MAGIPPAADAADPVIQASATLRVQARLLLDDIPGARAAYRAATEHASVPLELDEVMLPSAFSLVACVEGQLREAEHLADGALSRAERLGALGHPMVAPAFRTRGCVLYERGHFDAAEAALERSIAVSERVRPVQVSLGHLSLARVLIADGRTVEAAESLEEARSVLGRHSHSPVLDLIIACEAHLALAVGDMGRAEEIVRSLPPSERQLRLQASVLLARHRPAEALDAARRHPTAHAS